MGKKIIKTILLVVLLLTGSSFTVFGVEGIELSGPLSGRSLYNNINFSDIGSHWAREYIYRMAALSVVRGYGNNRFMPEQVLTGQEAVSLILRQKGLEEEAQRLGSFGLTSDQGVVASWAAGYLELAVSEGLITEGERYGKNWTAPVQIQDVIYWLAKSLDLAPVSGQSQQAIFNFKDWQNIKPEYLSYFESAYQRGLVAGEQNKYLHPQRSIKRGELVSLLARIDNELLSRRGQKINRATVKEINSVKQLKDGKTVNLINYSLANKDGSFNQLVAEIGSGSIDREFPVYKNNQLGLSSLLNTGDLVEYIINTKNEVLYVAVIKPNLLTVEGQFLSSENSGNLLTIFSPQGELFSYSVAANVEVSINEYGAELEDLIYGQDVLLTVQNGEITKIKAGLEGVNTGYITPGRRVISGRVSSLWGDRIVVVSDTASNEFILPSGVQIIKEGRLARLGSIKAGDFVKLYFDEIKTNKVSKVEVSGSELLLLGLYRGELGSVSKYGGKIVINNLERYNHGQWIRETAQSFLEIDQSTLVYFKNNRVSLDDLADKYRGSQAYIATANYFGREKAVKIGLAEGYQLDHYGKLSAHDWANNRLVVENNQLNYSAGTIVVSEGRLVDQYALNQGDGIFVSGDQGYYWGENSAYLVVVEGSSSPKLQFEVYLGRIEWVRNSWYQLDDYYYYRLDHNEWQKINSSIVLSINNDTMIVDASEIENVQLVPLNKFMESQYNKKYTISDSWSYWTYSVADGQNVLGLVITKPGSWTERRESVSTARVKSINQGDKYIEVEEVKDWNSFNSSWNINSALNQITTGSAVVIKNGRAVNFSELNRGDQLYLVRDGSCGLVIIAK